MPTITSISEQYSAMEALDRRQTMEKFLKEFGYPVGVDFRTNRPIYWTSPEAAVHIVESNCASGMYDDGYYTPSDTMETFSGRTHPIERI